MPPPGGNRTPLSSMVQWLTSIGRKPTTQANNAADKPVDVNQFKETFQPDDGVFSPNLPLPPQDVQAPPRVWDFPSSYNTTFTPKVVGADQLPGTAVPGGKSQYHASGDRHPEGSDRIGSLADQVQEYPDAHSTGEIASSTRWGLAIARKACGISQVFPSIWK
jgi:hypothetical protein